MHRVARSFFLLILAAALALPSVVLAAGGSSAPAPPAVSTPTLTPEQIAAENYNRALKYRNKAWELEKELATAAASKAGKIEKKIEKEYKKGIKALEAAIEAAPSMYQAHSSLGYALRKTGDYTGSLAAYDQALMLNPSYSEAIEYRAEAYLALNRLDEVKEAYMHLFREDRERADELMAAIGDWIEARRAQPGDVDTATLEEFTKWAEERGGLAKRTASLSARPASSW